MKIITLIGMSDVRFSLPPIARLPDRRIVRFLCHPIARSPDHPIVAYALPVEHLVDCVLHSLLVGLHQVFQVLGVGHGNIQPVTRRMGASR